jgi:hypothetical protein
MEYYIYVYLNPLKPGGYNYGKFKFEYEPFYIGLGKKNRINKHIIYAKHKDKYQTNKTLKDNIILKILKNNQIPIRYKLYENITLESAIRLEKYLIKLIGRRDLKNGTLANLTDGGEGTVGKKYTKTQIEHRINLSKKLWSDGIFDNRDICGEKNGFFKRKHTDETKERIRKTIGDNRKGEKNSNYGNKWTEYQKQEASLRSKITAQYGDANPAKRPEVREKISITKIGNKNPNAKKWLLISPNNEEFFIDGGIKRNLKEFNLTYSMFSKDSIRITKSGWKLKEI